MNRPQSLRPVLCLPLFGLLAGLPAPVANACMGTPPPLCARTLSFSTAAPGVVLAPGGGVIDVNVPGLAFFNVIEAPPGACPPLRAGGETGTLTGTVDVECTGPDDGSGSLAATPIVTGFTTVDLSVTLDSGPPRLCTLASTVMVTMLDGTTLTAESSNNVCVGEAIGNPAVPRLDIRISDGGSNVARVHPGDQASFTYVLTNNDPVESFSGKLSVSLINSSRLPQQTPPGTLDDGPYAVSSPVEGDNFPIGFVEDLVNGCLYVPRDVANPMPSTLNKHIDLAPGESTEVDVYARPFQGCGSGSCGTALVLLQGSYSDQSDGLACTGFVVAADTTANPQFAWAGGGAALAAASAPAPFVIDMIALIPDPFRTVPMSFVKSIPELNIGGEPFLDPLTPNSYPYEGDQGRITATAGQAGQTLAPGGTSFSYTNEIQISPGAPFQFNFTRFDPGGPAGQQNVAPASKIEVAFSPFGATETEWFMDVMVQFSADATFASGAKASLDFDTVDIGPGAFPNAFSITVNGELPSGDGSDVEILRFANDLRGFARPASDYDLDGGDDHLDNCILVPNADQRDTDGDGFGNLCDADFNNDGVVNTIDLGIMRAAFFSQPGDPNWNPDTDMNGDNVVNAIDLGRLRSAFFQPPGPSGLAD